VTYRGEAPQDVAAEQLEHADKRERRLLPACCNCFCPTLALRLQAVHPAALPFRRRTLPNPLCGIFLINVLRPVWTNLARSVREEQPLRPVT
jgi:hypothetical protein